MTRFALFTVALFASACAADMDTNIDETSDELRASIEDIETETDRWTASERNKRIVRAIVQEYGPIAKRYECAIVGVLTGAWTDRSAKIKGTVLDRNAESAATFFAQMRPTEGGEGVFYGQTIKSRLNSNKYTIRGLFDGHAIDADMVPAGQARGDERLQILADWTPRGSGGFVKGVVTDCD